MPSAQPDADIEGPCDQAVLMERLQMAWGSNETCAGKGPAEISLTNRPGHHAVSPSAGASTRSKHLVVSSDEERAAESTRAWRQYTAAKEKRGLRQLSCIETVIVDFASGFEVHSVAFDRTGNNLAVGSSDGILRIIDATNGNLKIGGPREMASIYRMDSMHKKQIDQNIKATRSQRQAEIPQNVAAKDVKVAEPWMNDASTAHKCVSLARSPSTARSLLTQG